MAANVKLKQPLYVVLYKKIFFTHFPYFEKTKVSLCDHHAVCVPVYPLY
jgi:hypothetical protein